jgi:hypothetical protein
VATILALLQQLDQNATNLTCTMRLSKRCDTLDQRIGSSGILHSHDQPASRHRGLTYVLAANLARSPTRDFDIA